MAKPTIKKQIEEINIYSVQKLNKDVNDIFTEVRKLRKDGTLMIKSVLSGGTTPKYTTRTITNYKEDGTTVQSTYVYTLAYDAGDNLTSEVLQ